MLCHSLVLLMVVGASYGTGRLTFNPDRESAQPVTQRPQIYYDGVSPAECPELDGVFEDSSYCDSYWTCVNGVATETFCADGLVFDLTKAGHADPCDTPFQVDCGTRVELQEPTHPSEFCPRRNGVFAHPDTGNCNTYYQCVDAVHNEQRCAAGLHFHISAGNCNWPEIAGRIGCEEQVRVSADGAFSCPPGPHYSSDGVLVLHPRFPHADDCSKFYVCLSGETPQLASCDGGQVFDSVTQLCALPETVPECDGWFANDPAFAHYYEDIPGNAADPGLQDFAG